MCGSAKFILESGLKNSNINSECIRPETFNKINMMFIKFSKLNRMTFNIL